MSATQKRCSACKRVLPTMRFRRHTRNPDGLTYKCNECLRKEKRIAYEANRDKLIQDAKERYRKKSSNILSAYRKKYRENTEKIFSLLGDRCVRCGTKDRRVLQIDHINGGGNQERRIKIGRYYNDRSDFIDRIKNGSKEFQILCANCNLIEAIEKGYKKSIWQT